jgi:hypothetical protein
MHASLRVIAVIALSFALNGCEFAYPPCIANGYSSVITCRAAFSDGKVSDATILPRSIAWQGVEGRHVRSLAVVSRGIVERTYSSAVLDKIRSERPVKGELWILRPSGLRLEDFHSAAALRKELPKPPKT